MTPCAALTETARFCADQAMMCGEGHAPARPFLVTGLVLMAQQAASLALKEAGDLIPAQTGATELLLRCASPKHLPQPCTLPFEADRRRRFDQLVERRNAFMHPRGMDWIIADPCLSDGLDTVGFITDHLHLTQPVNAACLSAPQRAALEDALDICMHLASFLKPADL